MGEANSGGTAGKLSVISPLALLARTWFNAPNALQRPYTSDDAYLALQPSPTGFMLKVALNTLDASDGALVRDLSIVPFRSGCLVGRHGVRKQEGGYLISACVDDLDRSRRTPTGTPIAVFRPSQHPRTQRKRDVGTGYVELPFVGCGARKTARVPAAAVSRAEGSARDIAPASASGDEPLGPPKSG